MNAGTRRAGLLLPWALAVTFASGCDPFKTDQWRLLSPDKPIGQPERSLVNPIRPDAGLGDTTETLVPNATFPTDEDLRSVDRDYVIGPTDILNIGILDLFTDGVETVLSRRVSESGYVDLPMLPRDRKIKAAGLNERQLKEAVVRAYSPDILRDPTVSVSVVAPRQSVFSILGSVGRAGTYTIVRKDMRLLEALALAGDVTQANLRYVYIIRPTRPAVGDVDLDRPAKPAEKIAPPAKPAAPSPAATKPAPAGKKNDVGELRKLIEGTGPPARPGGKADGSLASSASQPAAKRSSRLAYKWVYTGGRWVRMAAGPGAPGREGPKAGPAEGGKVFRDPYGWMKAAKSDLVRIIAVNIERLKNGDPRMNIVIHENDIIHVPSHQVGEFYVMGEVARPGVYTLTGRHVTAKQAIAAAGNFGPMAWPRNSLLIRRVGPHQEQVIPLDLEAILRGRSSDVFLKPNDVIAVGTHVAAIPLAVLRNAFRLTYGFGFVYDRNFGDPYDSILDSKRFSRW